MVSTDGRVLLIEQAQLSDAGSYRCVASNVVGSTELQYSLRVNGELLRTKGICPQSCCSSSQNLDHVSRRQTEPPLPVSTVKEL